MTSSHLIGRPQGDKRRVALISDHASPLAALGGADSGGQNVYVAELARRLASTGHQVDVYTRRDEQGQPEIVEWAPGVRVIHLAAGPARKVPKERLWDHMPAFTEAFLEMAGGEGYDIVHANFWMSAAVALEAKRRLGLPFVVTFHALGKVRRQHLGEDDAFPGVRLDIEAETVRAADRIIAECPQDEQDLIRLYDATPGSLTLVPCGVTAEDFYPINRRLARRHLGIDDDAHVTLVLGRMVPRKGVETVIEAVELLRRRFGRDTHLLVVGGESPDPDPEATPEIGRLMGISDRLGVSDSVTFVGARSREELKYYYSSADVFVTVPWYEPFGMTPLEAMACGTPVIGSNVGGIKFSVRDGETGYLVPPRSPDAIADRIVALGEDPRLGQIFSAQGVRRARDLFGWDRVADMIAGVYEQVLAEDEDVAKPQGAETVDRAFVELVEVLTSTRKLLSDTVSAAAAQMSDTLLNGGSVLVAGNGGSASQAQHLAAELVGRFRRPGRRALPAHALCSDSAVLTAWANDVGYDDVYARQVEALARPGDLLVGLSTSGNSANVIRAFEEANRRGVDTLALTGGNGGALRRVARRSLIVPSRDTQRIQEVHALIIHLLAELVEERVISAEGTALRPAGRGADERPAVGGELATSVGGSGA